MLSEKNNTSEFNQYMKPGKMPHIIYTDIECLIEKIMQIIKKILQQQK